MKRAIEDNLDELLRLVLRMLRRMNVQERSQGRSPADIAGDVLADACLAVLKNAHRFDIERDPLPWIMGCAARVALRHREEVFGANKAVGERLEVFASEIAGEEQSGDEALEDHAATLELSRGLLGARRSTALETRQALSSLLAPLSPHERELIALSVFEEYDSPQVAARLGISAPAARKRLQRALDRLRAHIARNPEQFAWIENLPARLEQRALKSGAPAKIDLETSCHSAGASRQQPEQDSPAPLTTSASASASASASTRSNSMKSLSAPLAALSAGPSGGEPSP